MIPRRPLVGCVLGSMFAFWASTANADLPAYQVKDLGTLGGAITQATDLNERGQVTGYSETASGELRAFLYTDGRMRDLGSLGGSGALGNALNDAGYVTGFSVAPDGRTHAFLYANGVMRDVGLPNTETVGSDISNTGQIAGFSIAPDGRNRAFAYTGGHPRDLGLPANTNSFATAINDLGDIVGSYQDGVGTHVFFYRLGTRRDVFPGHVSAIFGSQALNGAGQVTGSYQRSAATRGFLYANGRAIDIGTLGGDYSYGIGINGNGDVTGVSATSTGQRHAFLYYAGSMTDVGTLGGSVSFGYAINRSRQVVGESTNASGGYHAFVTHGGRMVDLGLAVERLQRTGFLESLAYDINSVGQVIGRYNVPDAANPSLVRFRGFIATPIVGLFDALLVNTTGVGPGKSLFNRVKQASLNYAAQDKARTCSTLAAFVKDVAAQAGKKVPRALAASLQADARGIADAIACPAF
jgi:probable HAF family extracellular repeat protein